jgi:hypothetical protein
LVADLEHADVHPLVDPHRHFIEVERRRVAGVADEHHLRGAPVAQVVALDAGHRAADLELREGVRKTQPAVTDELAAVRVAQD